MTDFDSLIFLYKQFVDIQKKVDESVNFLHDELKSGLKIVGWDHYTTQNKKGKKYSISLSKTREEKVDESQLPLLLSKTDLAKIVDVKETERILLFSPTATNRKIKRLG
jgi:hypothetical protein